MFWIIIISWYPDSLNKTVRTVKGKNCRFSYESKDYSFYIINTIMKKNIIDKIEAVKYFRAWWFITLKFDKFI